jgi:2-polyprenyl-3-methyl-5-hydroxy-6-metoxy-1,4-benzoquinol methylase
MRVDPVDDLRWRKDGHDILRCPTCGLLFRADLPEQQDLREIYGPAYFRADVRDMGGQGYSDYVAEAANHKANAVRRLKLLERYIAPGRLLDVGAAAGFFVAEATKRNWKAQGVELADEMAAYAHDRLGVDVRASAFGDVVLAAASLDVVTMWDYIEHSVDPLADLRRAAALLRPGGVLCVSTGDAASIVARASRSRWHLLTPHHHNYFFTTSVLERALAITGFEVVDAAHRASLYSSQYLLHKLRTLWDASVVRRVAAEARRHRFGQWTIPVNLHDIITVVARRVPSAP